MNTNPANPELPPTDTSPDDDEFLDMSSSEFERFLAIAIEGYADAMEAKLADISTFREVGVLTRNRGLVVKIGDAEFQITIVKS